MQDTKILTIQDFSSFGQCSITVALPILSALGIETVALPTAVLSTHTSEFKDYVYSDLSSTLLERISHIKTYCNDFGYIYTGYLGTCKNVENAQKILEMYPNTKSIIDPAMAENGQLYDGIQDSYVDSIRKLCQKSFLCLPNLSEACLLAEMPYPEQKEINMDFVNRLCKAMLCHGISHFVITGIQLNNKLAIVHYNNNKQKIYLSQEVEGKFYGCGDVFASTIIGCLANNLTLADSLTIAIDFTHKCIVQTQKDASHWYGIKFEKQLPYLWKLVENIRAIQGVK